RGPKPSQGRWVIGLISLIDKDRAFHFWHESYLTERDPLTRAGIAAEAAWQGDNQYLRDLLAFLEKPPAVRGKSRADELRGVQQTAVGTMIRENYQPALNAVRRLALFRQDI